MSLLDEGNSPARRRELLHEAMRAGREALSRRRSGEVVFAFADGTAALPVDPRVRVDPEVVNEREWLLTAAAVGALVAAGASDLAAGGEDHLILCAPGADPEFAVLAFEEYVARIDRVRPRPVVLPEIEPPADAAPLLNREMEVAVLVARSGANPADAEAVEGLEEAIHASTPTPHKDPDPARRAARRILQRLNGMGKWGGYHTAFEHLARGFAGNERELAYEVGEALLAAGLLAEKPSVGQRHVFLNPRRKADIHALMESGDVPSNLTLPS